MEPYPDGAPGEAALRPLHDVAAELRTSVWATGAIAVAVAGGILDQLGPAPRRAGDVAAAVGSPEPMVAAVLDVLSALSVIRRVDGGYQAVERADGLGGVRAELLATLLQATDVARRAHHGTLGSPSWEHVDVDVLQTQGDVSAGPVSNLVARLLPTLDPSLPERLSRPSARFLDVGTGVASSLIAVCRSLPALRAVGIDVADAPLALARRNVEEAGLGDRVELRRQAVQDLAEVEAYDLVWLPVVFMPTAVVAAALQAVRRALRPGGWVLMGAMGNDLPGLGPALTRFRAASWGGEVLTPDDLERLAVAAGFDTARRAPQTADGFTAMAAQRRLPDSG